jgi:hypothetical protein
MLSELFFDFIFGILLTISLGSLYGYYWFIPSPFNTSFLEAIFGQDDSTNENHLKSFLGFLIFFLISFIIQIFIPLGCVILKRFLTSQLAILDVLIICTSPAVCLICITLISWWAYYTDKRKLELTIYPASSNKRFDPNLFKDLPILIREISPIGGLLAICISGGLIGYLLDGRFD